MFTFPTQYSNFLRRFALPSLIEEHLWRMDISAMMPPPGRLLRL